MNTLKWIIAILMPIICVDNVFTQNPVTASFNENKSEIIIQNNRSEIIYIYRKDTSDKVRSVRSSEKNTGKNEKIRTFECLNVRESYVKVLPGKMGIFKIKKTNAKDLYYYTSVGDNVNAFYSIPIGTYSPKKATVRISDDEKRELSNTKIKVDSIQNLLVAKSNFDDVIENHRIMVEKSITTKLPTTEKKADKIAPPPEKPNKKDTEKTQPDIKQEETLNTLRREYERIDYQCQNLKTVENLQDDEKQYLKAKQRELKKLRADALNIDPAPQYKNMRNDLLSSITSLIEYISEITIAKSKTIREEYKEIYSKYNSQISDLRVSDSEIEALVSAKLREFSLIRWRNKDSIYSAITSFTEAVYSSEKEFEANRIQFIKKWQKEDKETLENLLIRQNDELEDGYNKLKYSASMYKKRIDELTPPYAWLILALLVGLITLIALIFYIRAFFKSRLIKNHKTKIIENSICLIEDDKEVSVAIYESGLEEVRRLADADEYYVIDMNTIFNDTAIEKIYISKNCILSIYRFFLEFLKLNGKTNETGCFVIGRWEQVTPNSYNISLEEIIEPGNDAIYGEYELDFGTQIGIGLESAIINLRQLTQKDYVHTCWIHSHPSIGLFLSNHDLIVQSQLVYNEHPMRMLAIVIDSNTDDLDTAFFTYKKSGVMNNKEDMKSILSFEKMAQWAKGRRNIEQPQRITYNENDYYKLVSNSPDSIVDTFLFSGASIIEMDYIISPNTEGLKGYFYGEPLYKDSDEFLQKKVLINNFSPSKTDNNEVPIGCLLVLPYFTYQAVLSKYEPIIDSYDFFVVYNPLEDTIRIISRSLKGKYLIVSERDLNSVQMAEMKKWTRRRRV